MANQRVKDMTVGSPMKLILSFMVPLIFGLLFQQFYSMVDTMVVGRFLGVDALAGVGSTGAINFLVLGFCNGLCSGFAIPVAQKFGQKDFDSLRRYVGNTIWLASGCALVVTVLTTVLCRRILTWMNTPAETFQYAYDYIFLIFLGIPGIMLYNLLSGILRSLGDSRTPLIFLIISSLTNVVLDVVFIVPLRMGVSGAAWATVLSQLLSGGLCLLYMIRHYPILHLSREELRPVWRFQRHLLMMGVPMGLQFSITAIGSTMLQTAVNGLGKGVMAAVTAGGKVSNFCTCPFDALGTTVATFTGQNVGAGKLDRVRKGVRASVILGAVYSVLSLGILYLWGAPLSQLFLDSSEVEVIAMSREYLVWCAVFYIPLALIFSFRLSIQGMGYSEIAVGAGIFELVARGVFAMLFVPRFGFTAVCLASPAAWVMADVFLIPAYCWCMRKLEKKMAG